MSDVTNNFIFSIQTQEIIYKNVSNVLQIKSIITRNYQKTGVNGVRMRIFK